MQSFSHPFLRPSLSTFFIRLYSTLSRSDIYNNVNTLLISRSISLSNEWTFLTYSPLWSHHARFHQKWSETITWRSIDQSSSKVTSVTRSESIRTLACTRVLFHLEHIRVIRIRIISNWTKLFFFFSVFLSLLRRFNF